MKNRLGVPSGQANQALVGAAEKIKLKSVPPDDFPPARYPTTVMNPLKLTMPPV